VTEKADFLTFRLGLSSFFEWQKHSFVASNELIKDGMIE